MGRRPGHGSTRQDILDAAIQVFAERGYAEASLRMITARAGVDVSLVRHFFGGKEGLFDEAVLQQVDTAMYVLGHLGTGPEPPAERLAEAYLSMWEEPSTGFTLRALFRAALESARNRDKLQETMLGRLEVFAASLGPTEAGAAHEEQLENLQLLGSHLMGLGVARYVLQFSPLTDMPRERLLADITGTVERYLPGSAVAALDAAEGGRRPRG